MNLCAYFGRAVIFPHYDLAGARCASDSKYERPSQSNNSVTSHSNNVIFFIFTPCACMSFKCVRWCLVAGAADVCAHFYKVIKCSVSLSIISVLSTSFSALPLSHFVYSFFFFSFILPFSSALFCSVLYHSASAFSALFCNLFVSIFRQSHMPQRSICCT